MIRNLPKEQRFGDEQIALIVFSAKPHFDRLRALRLFVRPNLAASDYQTTQIRGMI